MRLLIKEITYITLLILLFSFELKSQEVDDSNKTDLILSRFEERFQKMDSIIFKGKEHAEEPSLLDTATFRVGEYGRVAAVDKAVDAQISAMKSITGLDMRGQVYGRPGTKISYDPDDPLVAYNAKIQAELEWNIFHSSLYKRASKIKELKLKGEIRQLDYARNDLEEAILLERQKIRFRHYSRLLYVINLHVDNIRLLMDTQSFLLEQGKISGDDLLKLINQQTELERQLISIKADEVIEEVVPPRSVAYIELTDTAGMFESIKSNNIELKKLGLQYDLLTVQRNNTDYVQTMDILPFVRYSYYNRENVHNTYNIDLGVSFKLPITRHVKQQRRAIESEQEVIDYERQLLENETYKGLYLTFHDLEIYNENIRGEYLRMQRLKEFLGMRTDSYYNVTGEYSRINRLEEYNSYLQAWERLLEYMYQRDLILIRLQSYLLAEPISKYIVFKELN